MMYESNNEPRMLEHLMQSGKIKRDEYNLRIAAWRLEITTYTDDHNKWHNEQAI